MDLYPHCPICGRLCVGWSTKDRRNLTGCLKHCKRYYAESEMIWTPTRRSINFKRLSAAVMAL